MVCICILRGYGMNLINGINTLIRRIRWMNLCLWLGLMTMSFTIWYFIIKLIFKILN